MTQKYRPMFANSIDKTSHLQYLQFAIPFKCLELITRTTCTFSNRGNKYFRDNVGNYQNRSSRYYRSLIRNGKYCRIKVIVVGLHASVIGWLFEESKDEGKGSRKMGVKIYREKSSRPGVYIPVSFRIMVADFIVLFHLTITIFPRDD